MAEDAFDPSWITEAAARLGVAVPDAACVEAVLALASHAAHGSGDRRNAPVLAFLAGLSLDPDDARPRSAALDELLADLESPAAGPGSERRT